MKVFKITSNLSFPKYIKADNIKKAVEKANEYNTQVQGAINVKYTENDIKEV